MWEWTDTVQHVCAFCGEPLEEGADFCTIHCSMPVEADTVWCPFCGKKAFESDVGLIDTTDPLTHGNTPSDEEIDAAQKNFHKPPTL
ncbi:MAG: hypothetical protein LUG26_07405 [Ruminococcus sp.]|nr:hypothetical protein [Ruminococcus sp.]